MAVMLEMIKKEVRSSMIRLKEQTGVGSGICMGMNMGMNMGIGMDMGMRVEDGFREVALKRIGVSRINSCEGDERKKKLGLWVFFFFFKLW